MSASVSNQVVQNMSIVLWASAASMMISGVTVGLARRWSTPERVKTLLSYGTGYLMALAVFELTPHAWHHLDQNLPLIAGLAAIGAFFVWLSERVLATQRRKPKFRPFIPHDHHSHHAPHAHRGKLTISHKACCGFNSFSKLDQEIFFSVVACICLCAFFDGVTLSAALMANPGSPTYALSGVLAHMVPEVVVLGLITRSQYASTRKAALYCAGATLLFFLGNVASHLSVLIGISKGGILATAAGMMVYISIAHLMPKFIDGRRDVLFASLGFATFLLTDLLHLHHT
jgi:zinc transporter ZupT